MSVARVMIKNRESMLNHIWPPSPSSVQKLCAADSWIDEGLEHVYPVHFQSYLAKSPVVLLNP